MNRMRFGKEDLIGCIQMGAFLTYALAKEAVHAFDREIIFSEYDIRGHPNFRKIMHHELMKKSREVQERETGSVFLMQDEKTALSLGRSKRDDEYGWFSLDTHRLSRFWRGLKVDACEKIFGEDIQSSLRWKSVYELLEHKYKLSLDHNNPKINLNDLNDPRTVYIQQVTLTVSHEIPLGGDWYEIIKNPRTFSHISPVRYIKG